MKCFAILAILFCATLASARVLVGSDPYPPLIYPGPHGALGSVPDTLPELLNVSPQDIDYRFYPWKRVLMDAQK